MGVFWLVLPLVLKKTNAWNESNWVSVDVEITVTGEEEEEEWLVCCLFDLKEVFIEEFVELVIDFFFAYFLESSRRQIGIAFALLLCF